MSRSRLAALFSSFPAAPPRAWLAAAVLAVGAAAAVQAQAPPAAPPAAPAATRAADVAPAGPEAEAALALDKKLIAEAKAGSEVMKNLTYLSDVIGPRLTGSANLKRANEWAAEVMKSYGLSNVHLEPWTIPVGWERGTATARILEPDNGRSLTIAAMAWTPGTNGKVVGDVVALKAENKDDLAKYKGKLKNAIILRGPPAKVRPITDTSYGPFGSPADRPNRNGRANRDGAAPRDPDAPRPGTPPAGDRPAAERNGQPPAGGNRPAGGPPTGDREQFFSRMMAFRRELSEFLRSEGAAVMLMDSQKPQGLLNMTGSWRGNERADAADPMTTVFITNDHYALLWRLATRSPEARTRVEIEVTNKFVPGPITVYNTVGEIRGSEKPDEFVVVGAHLDSWDLGQGTTDNGTGSCVVLETARILSKSGVKPKRTIRFVLFTGEEEGLHGSRAYVNAHKDEMARTSLAIVHDTGTGRVVGVGTQRHEALKPIFERELVSLKDLGVKEINTRSLNGSDHQSFDGAGVPGIMFQQDMSEYRFTHHSQSDTLDKAKEPDLVQGAQVMAVMAARFANLDSLLPHHEVRPARRGFGGE
jgi:carboxypeptidase Q